MKLVLRKLVGLTTAMIIYLL